VAPPDAAAQRTSSPWRVLGWIIGGAVVIAGVVLLWNQGKRFVNGDTSGAVCYLLIIALVMGDALIPILPGETTLNAACVLAASGKLSLPLIVICGAIGAVVGDTCLYWLSRKARGRPRRWLDRAADAQSVDRVRMMLDAHGRLFLLFGRYVPGLRFALNVVLGGIVRMPFRTFLPWSATSGTLWSLWVCLSAYYISSALAGYPVAALIVSTCFGTTMIVSIIWLQGRVRHHHGGSPTPA
jgi:membrane protein DedA with SNARE-associated domain